MRTNTNQQQTPTGTPKSTRINFHKKNEENDYIVSDKCRVHLAECYAAKKRIEMLNGLVEEKNNSEEITKRRLEEEERNTHRIEMTYNKEVFIYNLDLK